MTFFRPALFLLALSFTLQNIALSQSADSRICNCLSTALSPGFMDATKAFYGRVGVVVRRNEELKPEQGQSVRFSIPRLSPKQGCGAVYSIIIRDESGSIVYQSEDSHNEFSYTFSDCGKRYEVDLTASVKSPGGNDGNCSRGMHFYIRPNCNTQTCTCDPPSGAKPAGTSINIGVTGKLQCGVVTATTRTYTFQYKFTNKTRCAMMIESVSVHGETLGGGSAVIPAGGSSAAFNTSVSTALSKAPPTGSSVNITVRYKVNDRSCTAMLKIPYTACR